MDLALVMNHLLPGISYNPAFVDFTEVEAREKKLWTAIEPMPAAIELNNAWIIVETSLNETQYITDRANAHIPITEQLDMQYWDMVNGTMNWKDYVDNIKATYPKNSLDNL